MTLNDSDPMKPKRRWYQFSLRTLLVFVSEANTLSARRSVVNNSAFWSVVLVLAALAAGCGKGPDTTRPSQEATPATEKVSPAAQEATPATEKVITNSIGMKMVLIPAGEFMMGSPEGEEERSGDEKQHRIRITKPYYLGVYEVTQEQYEKVTGANPSLFKGATRPVEQVSWEDAVEFCRKLSRKEGRTYRLPTEAEWEYACRAGTTTPFHFGGILNGKEANCDGNYPYGTGIKGPYLKETATVGSYAPNAWGLYDMHGNVYEWCADSYDSDYYGDSPTDDPTGPATRSYRVVRGGSWGSFAGSCRSAFRGNFSPGIRFSGLGFRVALVPSE